VSALLELQGVCKSFPAPGGALTVLDGAELALGPGERVAVLGPSGSGKSTLLGLAAGLERADGGRVLFKGAEISSWDEDRLSRWRRVSVGFVFQSFRLVESLTALENAALPLDILGRPAEEARARAGELLRGLGLWERRDHFPSRLSGGEQQRVAVARAFAHGPELILADEPTGSLDRASGARALDALLAAAAERATALLVVTHDPAVAARMTRALALESGRLVPAPAGAGPPRGAGERGGGA